MRNTLGSRLLTGILILNVIGLGAIIGGDVTVQDGDLNADRDVNAGRDVNALEDVNATEDLSVGDDAWVGWNLDVYNIAYAGAVWSDGAVLADDVYSYYDIEAEDNVEADNVVGYSIGLFAKVYSSGGYDPPYVLYDKQTRQQIADRIKREVPPDKQNGAALFFNAETKKLEIYVAGEGKFYDLLGNVTYALSRIEQPTTKYEAAHYVDRQTGLVETWQKPVQDKYRIRKEYTLDEKTGQFANKYTGEAVAREQALERHVPGEGNVYDLQGNLLRNERRKEDTEYVTEYYFDRRTGEVKPIQRAVCDRYVIKKGFDFDRKTGKFVDESSGEEVSKETALQVVRNL